MLLRFLESRSDIADQWATEVIRLLWRPVPLPDKSTISSNWY